jgi:multiple sugar transport system substrate-binding protein
VPGYRGLTWDHPRGSQALGRAAELRCGVDRASEFELSWDVHSLAGFESTPIEQTAKDYDLIVLDHPHLGSAISTGSVIPLDSVFDASELDTWRASSVGRTFESYEHDGLNWALPLDAASQVAVARPELRGQLPRTWAEVEQLASHAPVALSLAGPHAALTLMSICVALGEEPAVEPGRFVSSGNGTAALELMRRLGTAAPTGSDVLDPIALLETMQDTDAILYCPLVFGYVTYSAADPTSGLVFGDAPRATGAGRPGSTLGGTGLAISTRCAITPALLDHLRWLMSDAAQTKFLPAEAGQPSSAIAWSDEAVNAASGNFYRNTRATIDDAWVRPRYDGYIGFQTTASEVIRAAMSGRLSAHAAVRELNELYEKGTAHDRHADAART